MRVLGIDPGIAIVGWGLVESVGQKLSCLGFGTIETDKSLSTPERLRGIFLNFGVLLESTRPDIIVIEELFFAKNRKTAMNVAQARGTLLAAASVYGDVLEITPPQVKQFIAFSGRAQKARVGEMVKRILDLPSVPKPDDAADAVAIALCGTFIKTTGASARWRVK